MTAEGRDGFAALQSRLERYGGQAGIVLRDLRTGDVALVNPDLAFPAASIIKLTVLWEFHRQVEAGGLRPDQIHILQAREKVHTWPLDPGVLREMHDGLPLTMNDLLALMIIVSDDTATNILLDTLGIDNINRSMQALGLEQTVVRRKMMDYEKARAGIENTTTARDCDRFLQALLDGGPDVSAAGRRAMLDLLAKQQVNTAIPLLLPRGMRIAHKTGYIEDFSLEHDVGILYEGAEPVLAASFLTRGLPDSRTAIGETARDAFAICRAQ